MADLQSDHDSPKIILGEILAFVGPLMAIGGLLIIIVRHFHDLFYATLAPIGIGLWIWSLWLRKK